MYSPAAFPLFASAFTAEENDPFFKAASLSLQVLQRDLHKSLHVFLIFLLLVHQYILQQVVNILD